MEINLSEYEYKNMKSLSIQGLGLFIAERRQNIQLKINSSSEFIFYFLFVVCFFVFVFFVFFHILTFTYISCWKISISYVKSIFFYLEAKKLIKETIMLSQIRASFLKVLNLIQKKLKKQDGF